MQRLSPKARETALDLACSGATNVEISSALGLSRREWADVLSADEGLRQDVDRARDMAVEDRLDAVHAALTGAQSYSELRRAELAAAHARWIASKRLSLKYGERVRHEHEGAVNILHSLDRAERRIRSLAATKALPHKRPDDVAIGQESSSPVDSESDTESGGDDGSDLY